MPSSTAKIKSYALQSAVRCRSATIEPSATSAWQGASKNLRRLSIHQSRPILMPNFKLPAVNGTSQAFSSLGAAQIALNSNAMAIFAQSKEAYIDQQQLVFPHLG